MTAREARARALRDAPADPNTLERLAGQGRVDEATAVFERIVADHPDRIAAALRAVFRENSKFFSDRRVDRKPVFRDLSARIKQRLPALPRDTAAEITRELIRLDLGEIARLL